MKSKNESIYYITVGSTLFGIIFTSLTIIGYFPHLSAILNLSIITAFIILLYVMALSIACEKSKQVQKMVIMPLLAGIFGTIASCSLTLTTYLNPCIQSTLLLLFLSSCFFTFMLSYFFKLMLNIFSENK